MDKKIALKEPKESPLCPKCGAAMTRRTARKGPMTGYDFWGCKRYPRCKGTRPLYEKSQVSSKEALPEF